MAHPKGWNVAFNRATIFGIRGTFQGWVDNASGKYSPFIWNSRSYSESGGDWTHTYVFDGPISIAGWNYITYNITHMGFICSVEAWSDGRRISSLSTTMGGNAGNVYNKKLRITTKYLTLSNINYRFSTSSKNYDQTHPDDWFTLSLS